MAKIGLVVPVLYNFEGCVELMHSFKTSHDWQPYIIDNWRHNNCVAKAWNDGIDAAREGGCDYIVVANDDIILAPASVDNMISHIDDEHIIVTATRAVIQELGTREGILTYTTPVDGKMSSPDFACWSARSDILDIVGRVDENFKPAYFEDDDYVRRIVLMGKKVVRSLGAPMWHDGSKTQNWFAMGAAGTCDHQHFEFNRDYYVRKWGLDPGFEKFDTPYGIPEYSLKEWKLYPPLEHFS